ncbi:hypothetical protein AVEN_224805-1 [Araneus ventricosus]|uniref:Uncharacterized protein n=1 Tax=Araneus ventricosus TaxID=182803 RepID=A0A4Y2G0G0_ARAVE|nr:hypothetical protein AVEN_224805-1 [Araneus ventricosus]
MRDPGCREGVPKHSIGIAVSNHVKHEAYSVGRSSATTGCHSRAVPGVSCEMPFATAHRSAITVAFTVAPRVQKSTSSKPWWSQKTVALTFSADGTFLNFLWRGRRMVSL